MLILVAESISSGADESQNQLATPNVVTRWTGFRIGGDNIDKNIRPSVQRCDNKTNSMHCFHMYAVQDRIDLSLYSDSPPTSKIDVKKLLVTKDDFTQMTSDAVVLISRYV